MKLRIPFTKAPDVRLQGTSSVPLLDFSGESSTSSYVGQYGRVGWVFACAALISSRVGAARWGAYRGSIEGDSEPLDDHPALALLRHPNPFMSRMALIETSTIYLDLAGEFFLNIVSVGGRPVELWPINPANMRHVADKGDWLRGWVHEVGRDRTPLDVSQVLHQRRPNPTDPYRGQSIIESINTDVVSDWNISRWIAAFWRNSAQPGGTLATDKTLTDVQHMRLKEEWESSHRGVNASHRVAILEGGVEYKQNEVHLRNLQVEQIRDANARTIMAAFNVSPANLGIVENVNRANAEAAAESLATNVIDPRLVRIRESINEQIVPMFPDSADVFLDFVSTVPANKGQMIDVHSRSWENGLIPRNMALDGLGLATIDGPEGDEYKAPTAAMPQMALSLDGVSVSREQTAITPKAEPDDTPVVDPGAAMWKEFIDTVSSRENRMRTWLVSEFETQERDTIRALRREGKALSSDPTKQIEASDIFDEARWIESASTGGEPHIRAALVSAANAFAAKHDRPSDLVTDTRGFTFDDEAEVIAQWIGSRMLRFSRLITATTQRDITRQLILGHAVGESIPDLAKRVQGVFEIASKSRARMIARTEIVSANNQGKLESAVQSEVVEAKIWFAAIDERVRDTHAEAHGQQVGLREMFEVGGDSMQTPGGGNLAEENINCRCTWQEVIKKSSQPNDHFGGVTDARCPSCNRIEQRSMPVGLEVWCHRCKAAFRNEIN